MAGSAVLTFTAVASGTSSITIEIDGAGAPNLPLSVTVVVDAITIQLATDAAGLPQSVPVNAGSTLLALYNSIPAAVALATLTVQVGNLVIPTITLTPLGPASEGAPIESPLSSLWLYDSNKVTVSNQPIMDIYMDGGQQKSYVNPTGSVYGNGAIAPPLWYPKDSVLQIDVYSQITDPTLIPTNLLIHLVGKKYYPC